MKPQELSRSVQNSLWKIVSHAGWEKRQSQKIEKSPSLLFDPTGHLRSWKKWPLFITRWFRAAWGWSPPWDSKQEAARVHLLSTGNPPTTHATTHAAAPPQPSPTLSPLPPHPQPQTGYRGGAGSLSQQFTSWTCLKDEGHSLNTWT